MEYLLNLQRQLGSNWVVEVGYLGSLSRHLYGFRDANQPIPGTTSLASRTPFAQLDASGQPVSQQFGVIQLVNDGANGNYNAGSIKVTKRFSAGLSVISSYTYAKSIDNTSGIRVQGFDTLYPQNSNCLSVRARTFVVRRAAPLRDLGAVRPAGRQGDGGSMSPTRS